MGEDSPAWPQLTHSSLGPVGMARQYCPSQEPQRSTETVEREKENGLLVHSDLCK